MAGMEITGVRFSKYSGVTNAEPALYLSAHSRTTSNISDLNATPGEVGLLHERTADLPFGKLCGFVMRVFQSVLGTRNLAKRVLGGLRRSNAKSSSPRQLRGAIGFGPEGRGFESLPASHIPSPRQWHYAAFPSRDRGTLPDQILIPNDSTYPPYSRSGSPRSRFERRMPPSTSRQRPVT